MPPLIQELKSHLLPPGLVVCTCCQNFTSNRIQKGNWCAQHVSPASVLPRTHLQHLGHAHCLPPRPSSLLVCGHPGLNHWHWALISTRRALVPRYSMTNPGKSAHTPSDLPNCCVPIAITPLAVYFPKQEMYNLENIQTMEEIKWKGRKGALLLFYREQWDVGWNNFILWL